MLQVPVYYDFASTLCYVAHRVMERMQGELEEMAIALEWRPVDLTRIAGWRRGALVPTDRAQNVRRVARELDVAVCTPARWSDSRAANTVALALAGSPSEAAWRERVYSAMHEERLAIEAPEVLERMTADLGLELAALDTPEARRRLERATDEARALDVSGVPSFLLSGIPIPGIQTDATMRSMLGRWSARQRGER